MRTQEQIVTQLWLKAIDLKLYKAGVRELNSIEVENAKGRIEGLVFALDYEGIPEELKQELVDLKMAITGTEYWCM